MSNIDKQALREAADAANETSWGRWESYHPHKGARGYEVKVGVKAIAQHCLKVDSVFIAAANPATVLALLDELEAAEHTAAVDHEAACSLVEENEELKRKLEAAEKRIAELEAKLETADKLQDSAFRNGLQHGFSYGQTNDQAGFEQCLAAYSSRGKANG